MACPVKPLDLMRVSISSSRASQPLRLVGHSASKKAMMRLRQSSTLYFVLKRSKGSSFCSDTDSCLS